MLGTTATEKRRRVVVLCIDRLQESVHMAGGASARSRTRAMQLGGLVDVHMDVSLAAPCVRVQREWRERRGR
jgi:hypothetical protein